MIAKVDTDADTGVIGHPVPRIAPPEPVRSNVVEFRQFSSALGIDLRPWQETVGKYLTAKGPDDVRWNWREIAVIVARQNGKTTLLVPLIVQRLLAGHRIMHTAQNRYLPREVFGLVADIMVSKYRDRLRSKPRFANGQESIEVRGGGHYRIVAPTRGGARGPSNDLVIIDELREMDDHSFIAAAKPTLTASKHPQMVYLSNAGTDDSEVLNALRLRAGVDPALAYLEWSAEASRRADDPVGWAEANPSMGHDPAVELALRDEYRAHSLSGTLAVFETEHLCRWVVSMRERLVDAFSWAMSEAESLTPGADRYLGVSMDPAGHRASVGLAWRMRDDTIAVEHVLEATGSPIDIDLFGADVKRLASKLGVRSVGYDPLTEGQVAKFLIGPEKINGQRFANASSTFRLAVHSGKIKHRNSAAITDDLTFTAIKPHDATGSYIAVRSDDDRPITAALAAVRAVELAANPPRGVAQIW